jgi:serine/threonine-protein kinase
VHRDVSPHNVLISFEGEVKLADFGIARALGASEVTAPGTIKGKLAYMAPEQARGDSVDARADVFALGAVLWELCTGRRLFGRDSDAATLNALMAEPVSTPSSWNETVPPDLDALVLAALERDPARRTPSAEQLASGLAAMRLRLATDHEDLDLRKFMRELWPEGASGWGARDATAVRPAGPGSAPQAPTRTMTRPRRIRKLALAGAGLGIAVAVVAVGLAMQGRWRGQGIAANRPPSSEVVGPAPSAPATPAPAGSAAPAPAPSSATPTSGETASAPAAAPAQAPAQAATTASAPPGAPVAAPPAGAPQPQETPPAAPAPSGSVPAPASVAPAPAEPAPAAPARLSIRVSPWAAITIDGVSAGETPIEKSIPPGVHKLRARHPRLGSDEVVVTLRPGQRYVWHPKLSP